MFYSLSSLLSFGSVAILLIMKPVFFLGSRGRTDPPSKCFAVSSKRHLPLIIKSIFRKSNPLSYEFQGILSYLRGIIIEK